MKFTTEQMNAASPAWHKYVETAEINEKITDAKAEFADALYEAYVAGFLDGKAAASREGERSGG